jgi:hypothetical protein
MVRGEEVGEAEGIRPGADSESGGGGLDRRRLQATPRKKPPKLNSTVPNLCRKLTRPTTQGWRQQRKSSEATDGRRYRGEEAVEAEGSGQEQIRRAAVEDWIDRYAKLLHEGNPEAPDRLELTHPTCLYLLGDDTTRLYSFYGSGVMCILVCLFVF